MTARITKVESLLACQVANPPSYVYVCYQILLIDRKCSEKFHISKLSEYTCMMPYFANAHSTLKHPSSIVQYFHVHFASL